MGNKILKTTVAFMFSISLLISLAACSGSAIVEVEENSESLHLDKKVGTYINFGSYEQDNNIKNGEESIEWLIIDVQDDYALVISKFGLDGQPFNKDNTDTTWETCTLRTWLNDEFISDAFTNEEKKLIKTTSIPAQKTGIVHNDITYDKVFLLSLDEVNKYFSQDSERNCKSTLYAKSNGVYSSAEGNQVRSCWWWLRTQATEEKCAMVVDYKGCVRQEGLRVDGKDVAVCPAMWVNLSGI